MHNIQSEYRAVSYNFQYGNRIIIQHKKTGEVQFNHLLICRSSNDYTKFKECIYFTDNQSLSIEEFLEYIKNNSYTVGFSYQLEKILNDCKIKIVNIDKFNSTLPNLKISVHNISNYAIFLKYKKNNVYIRSKFEGQGGDSLISDFSEFVKSRLVLDTYPDTLFHNLNIINELHGYTIGNYIDFNYLAKYDRLFYKKLPNIADIEHDTKKVSILINMLLRFKDKLNSDRIYKTKTLHLNYTKFNINFKYININFFGVKFHLQDAQDFDNIKNDKTLNYILGYLQTFDKFSSLLDKLEMQLLK